MASNVSTDTTGSIAVTISPGRVEPTDEAPRDAGVADVADVHVAHESAPADLKGRTVRGGLVTFIAQVMKVALNMGSTLILARLLTPLDYGLIGMVTGVTGFVETFKDAGLSTATIQWKRITDDQVSTLFWLNVALSLVLTVIVIILAPVLVRFFHEPRLALVAIALSATFFMSGLTVQHQALLRRNMRFTLL